MNSKKLCAKIFSEILREPDKLSSEAQAHLEDCAECKAELEKIRKTDALLKASAPSTPALKGSVLSRIRDEKLVPAPLSSVPHKHIPIGTISAVAAVLAVGILVYKGDILNKIDTAKSENDEMIVYDAAADFSPEALVEEWNNKTNGENSSANYQILTDSGSNSLLYSDEEVVEESAEAEEEPAHDAIFDKVLLKSEQESAESDDTAPTEAIKDSNITERGHLLSLLPPTNDSLSDISKPDGTQNTVANDITSNSISDTDGGTAGTTTSPAPAGVEDTKKAPEVMMLHPGSGMSGTAGGSSDTSSASKERTEEATTENINAFFGNISEKSDAAEVYKVLAQYYPDRISYEVFESADPVEYLTFVMSIEDFDTEYTESAFLGFCGKLFFGSVSKTEIL